MSCHIIAAKFDHPGQSLNLQAKVQPYHDCLMPAMIYNAAFVN